MASLKPNILSDLASCMHCPGPASFRLQIPYPLVAFIRPSIAHPLHGTGMMVPHAELTIIHGGAFGHGRRNIIWNLRKQVSWASVLQFLTSCGKWAGAGRIRPARRRPHGALTVRSRGASLGPLCWRLNSAYLASFRTSLLGRYRSARHAHSSPGMPLRLCPPLFANSSPSPLPPTLR